MAVGIDFASDGLNSECNAELIHTGDSSRTTALTKSWEVGEGWEKGACPPTHHHLAGDQVTICPNLLILHHL